MKKYTVKNNFDDRELTFNALYHDYSKGERWIQFYTYDKDKKEIVTKSLPSGSWLLWGVE